MNYIKFIPASLVIAAIVFLTGCNDENPVPDPIPDFPYKSSMVMDFEDFMEQDTSGGKSNASYQHWGRAATHVLVWNTAITITLAIPVKSFHEAFTHEAVYDPDIAAWVWSYNFWAAGVLHLAELQASQISEGVEWKMFITKNGHYSDFLWYTGVSNSDNTSGHWELKKHPENPTDFLFIEWNRALDNESADIKYTNVVPDNENYGSYIYYGTESNQSNAFYTIYGASQENIVNIEWSRTDKDGRIRDELWFGDNAWRCWDIMLLDTGCE